MAYSEAMGKRFLIAVLMLLVGQPVAFGVPQRIRHRTPGPDLHGALKKAIEFCCRDLDKEGRQHPWGFDTGSTKAAIISLIHDVKPRGAVRIEAAYRSGKIVPRHFIEVDVSDVRQVSRNLVVVETGTLSDFDGENVNRETYYTVYLRRRDGKWVVDRRTTIVHAPE